jgi:hypothetical protein
MKGRRVIPGDSLPFVPARAIDAMRMGIAKELQTYWKPPQDTSLQLRDLTKRLDEREEKKSGLTGAHEFHARD